MANEITLSFVLSVAKDSLVEEYNTGTTRQDLASDLGAGGAQEIGTASEALVTTNATAGGYFYARNLEPAGGNFIEIGSATALIVKLLPGEWCCFRANTATIHAKADGSASNLQYRLFSA